MRRNFNDDHDDSDDLQGPLAQRHRLTSRNQVVSLPQLRFSSHNQFDIASTLFNPTLNYRSRNPFFTHYPITLDYFQNTASLVSLLTPFLFLGTFQYATNPYSILLALVLEAYHDIPIGYQATQVELNPIRDTKEFKNEVASMLVALQTFDVLYKTRFKSDASAKIDIKQINTSFGYNIGSYTLMRILFSFVYLLRLYMEFDIDYTTVINNVRFDVTTVDTNNVSTTASFVVNFKSNMQVIYRIIYNFLNGLLQNGMERYKQIGQRPLDLDLIKIKVYGIRESMTKDAFKVVFGNNTLWMNIFSGAYGSKYDVLKLHMVVIPHVDNSNCFIRAINCNCESGRICSCAPPPRLPMQFYCIDRIKRDFINSDILFINIQVEGKKESYRKTSELIVKGKDFFISNNAKVIFINTTTYSNGSPHCCIMRIPISFDENETLEAKFKRYDVYNKLLALLCHDEKRICPCCGVAYYRKEWNTHWKIHDETKIKCERCGLQFDNDNDFKIHTEYHCRVRSNPYEMVIANSIKGYVEKGELIETIFYADLESAISEDGIHYNILCGWVCVDDFIVHVSDKLEEFISVLIKHKSKKILVYFHNGENYDFHFIITCLLRKNADFERKITLMCDSSEKIKSFSIFPTPRKEIMFKDTFAFISESLENWVKSTKDTNCEFKCFNRLFSNPDDELAKEFVFKKNPFPYKAIKDASYLTLNIEELKNWMEADNNVELFCNRFTDDELKQMAKEWYPKLRHHFSEIETIKDYYEIYLKCDVAQLCDCMEHFVKTVYEEYDGMCAHKYLGLPSLSWAAWLKQNKFQLDPIPEKAYDVIVSSIRGGQCGAMTRYYNIEEDETKSLCCDLDCNALYATVMLKFPFPCHDWVEIDVSSYMYNVRETEYVYEEQFLSLLEDIHKQNRSGFVELDFSVDSFNVSMSYVPIASKRHLKGIYSDNEYLQKSAELNNLDIDDFEFQGLVNVLGNHNHYCCHTRLLEFYMSHKFVLLKKIHKLWIANDEYVFADYVKNNLEKRKEFSHDPIKKSLYKLMNNSLYGKTYEDITKRQSLKIMHNDHFKKLPFYSVRKVLYNIDDYVIYEEAENVYTLDKPIYLGAAITEFSKLWMYKFYYDDIKPIFPNAEVYYTDTDALTIHFKDPTVTSFMDIAGMLNTEERQIIDTSNWSNLKDLPLSWIKHNNEPGLFKSETGDHKIIKMVALRAKSYIMVCENGEIKCSLKGCPKSEKDKVTFEDFYDILYNKKPSKIVEYEAILSKHHIVSSTMVSKLILSNDDRKRNIISPEKTLPWAFY